MANEKQNEFISSGVNRCRRCDRPLSDPTDKYGWKCAQISGLGDYNDQTAGLDDDETLMHNAYVKYLKDALKMRGDNFTTWGKNYKNTFIKQETNDPKKTKYTIISDIAVLGGSLQAEYTINDGAVIFKFEDNDYWPILKKAEEKLWQKPSFLRQKNYRPIIFLVEQLMELTQNCSCIGQHTKSAL